MTAGHPAMLRPRILSRVAVVVLVGLALFSVWLAGLLSFVDRMPTTVADPDTPTDAIVVLTGGSRRLTEGLRLLADHRARMLFVSGVYQSVEVQELLGLYRAAPEEVSCCVVLGHTADSTYGNARETAKWVIDKGYRSIRLVTADYHMQRSLFEFHRMMPEIQIIPNPVFPSSVRRKHWWRHPGTRRLYISEYDKYLFARLRSLIAGPTVQERAQLRDPA